MNALWQAPVVVVALITWLNATPTSFADAAQREALRRQLTPKPTRQLTNLNLPPSALIPIPDATPTPAPADASSASAQDAKPATPANDPKHDEQYWRSRVTAARKAFEDDQNLAIALQNRISSLTTDFVNRDDPAQRARISDDRRKATEQLDRMQKQIGEDKKAIDAVQDDARKAGVPPGWVR
jgi:hypothetical protein